MNTKRTGAISVAFAVAVMFIAVFAVTANGPAECTLIKALEYTGENTLRVYGEDSCGPGDPSVVDPVTENVVENLPYTESIAPFDPQHVQAPPKDSVTFNPLLLSLYDNNGEFPQDFLYKIKANDDAIEKVFLRMWYEPRHWDKDVDCDGVLVSVIRDGTDGVCDTMARGDDIQEVPIDATTAFGEILITPGANGVLESVPGDANGDGVIDRRNTDDHIEHGSDEAYPAVMQEFTYMLLEPEKWDDKPEPTTGRPGRTQFVFPVGMDDIDSKCGYGLTSIDADFDGHPDIVKVESELSLIKATEYEVAADFNGNGVIDPLDTDGFQLSGDELAVFTIEPKTLKVGQKLQFLDHMVEVVEIYNQPPTAEPVRIKVYYTGDMEVKELGEITLGYHDMTLAGTQGPLQRIQAISTGGTGTNMCKMPTGPWFAWIAGVDTSDVDPTATIMVGRALGHAHTAMEQSPDQPDVQPDDPWFLKRFYVDGHEYKVVAIETLGDGPVYAPCDCDPSSGVQCDLNDNGITDAPDDTTGFKYITIRTPIPKEGTYADPRTGYLIEQHSVRLQPYHDHDYLSVMPPFNHEHVMVEDIQKVWSSPVKFLGDLQFNTPPITQTVDRDADHIWYIEEDRNPQFTGELLEKYNEKSNENEEEYWYAEQWNTKPDQYTEFVLPTGHGLYLLTSAFVAPQAMGQIKMQSGYDLEIDGNRVKFWYDPVIGGKKYKDNESIRVYGEDSIGPGDMGICVDVPPYTDPIAIFNPQRCQAPRKDSITFDPAYMDEYYHGDEPLSDLYKKISIEERDAREKVFFRLWYEPDHWDKDKNNDGDRDSDECYPAVMEEFTYIYLNTADQPSHGQPATSRFAFPIATSWTELWNSFGYGLTTFDANFDGTEDIVKVYSEESLSIKTDIQADFDGDSFIQQLDIDGVQLSGDEMVIFAVDIGLKDDEYAMFLDHMIEVESVSSSGPSVNLKCYYTGGGLEPFKPNEFGTVRLNSGEMAILDRNHIRKLISGDDNLGYTDGAWFVYVDAVNTVTDSVSLLIGRALGETHVGIESDTWYLKRFYVDGHEYNVVAVKTVPADSGYEDYEFKFITIRTPVPKEHFEIEQHSQDLEDYPVCTDISVMPPFNYEHTVRSDIGIYWTPPYDIRPDNFPDDLEDMGYMGAIRKNKPPLEIHIEDEDIEEQFRGELKEMYNKRPLTDLTLYVKEYSTSAISGRLDGTVDGRNVEGTFSATMSGSKIRGTWEARDYGDPDDTYNDNEISDFDGIITGTWTKSGDIIYIDMVMRRDGLELADCVICWDEQDCTVQHDYLCFWAEFEFSADVTSDVPVIVDGGYDEDWEEWMTEQFRTMPDHYTAFELPADQCYLLTSSWYAPQAIWRTVNENNGGPRDITWYHGNRVKFWYQPDRALDIYVNKDTVRDAETVIEQWDFNHNGYIDRGEIVTAILSYLIGVPEPPATEVPTQDQLIELLIDYLKHR